MKKYLVFVSEHNDDDSFDSFEDAEKYAKEWARANHKPAWVFEMICEIIVETTVHSNRKLNRS